MPAVSLALYQDAAGWKEFRNIVALPEIPTEAIAITPSETTALIEWQAVANAEGYRLIIYRDEAHTDIVYELEFNASGELTRRQAKRAPQAADFSHLVENLQADTDYYYTLEVLGVGNVSLASQSDSFQTLGAGAGIGANNYSPLPQAVGCYSIMGHKLPQASGLYIILYDNGTAEKIVR